MQTSRPLVRHAIAYVDTLTEDGSVHRSGHVYCTRRGETIAASVCAHCPRFVKVVPGEGRGADTVQCRNDLVPLRASDNPAPLTLARLTVGALMTRNVVSVRPDLSLDAAVALFVETGLKALPVVDPDGALMGFVSEADVTLHVQATLPSARPPTVEDVFMPYALAVPETTPVTRAAALMAVEGQQRVAVVSRDNAVVGVLSASDVLYWIARADGQLVAHDLERRQA